jgi:hypothetical protein
MKVQIDRTIFLGNRIVPRIPEEYKETVKQIEQELIKKYKEDIDRVLKLAYEITNSEISRLKYSFTHTILKDKVITSFAFSAYFEDGLHIYKTLVVRHVTPLAIH